MKGRLELGDGDPCPLNPEHGKMYFMTDSNRQWCPDVSHEGRPKTHPDGPSPRERSFWPKGDDALRRAVLTVTLPEIDIALLRG